MKEIQYEIVKEIAVLSTSDSSYTKEINLISWNGNEPKYDIRSFSPNREKCGKGITLTADVGGKIKYQEIPDKKTGEMVPTLKFSNEDQIALDYRKIQETFGTEFYYAYAKQEDFKRFFQEMKLAEKA